MQAQLRSAAQWSTATLAFGLFGVLRALGPERGADLCGGAARRIGQMIPENRIGLANLQKAMPELSQAEHRRILAGCWDNLGRTAAEYPNLDRLWDFDPENPSKSRVEVDGVEHFIRLRDGSRPAIIFTAHLANWELLPIAAAKYGLSVSAVYRAPNNRYVAQKILDLRARSMGRLIPSGKLAALSMAAAIERGEHVGLLVDQHFSRGVPVPFFGRPAMTNPSLARMARRYECAIHGARVIRLPNHRFRVEMTPEIEPARDESGAVDIAGTMARVNAIVEAWVREHPEQWLWLHRRWRVKAEA
jgi:KDO2-lipid IV(A) lauroyltransferase